MVQEALGPKCWVAFIFGKLEGTVLSSFSPFLKTYVAIGPTFTRLYEAAEEYLQDNTKYICTRSN